MRLQAAAEIREVVTLRVIVLHGKIAVGKEWAVSPRFNLGVEAFGTYDGMTGLWAGFLPASTWDVFTAGLGLTFSTR